MWVTLLFGALLLYLVYKLFKRPQGDLHLIPGPSRLSMVKSAINGKLKQYGHMRTHLMLEEWATEYGPVMKVPEINGKHTVVVSDFDHIHEVLVTKGMDFGGRIDMFRFKDVMGHSGILQNQLPDKNWKTQRKITQKHFRQFGEGMTKLQRLLVQIGRDMFVEFSQHENIPFDPRDVIEETALKSVYYLLSGRVPLANDPVVELMKTINVFSREVLAITPTFEFRVLEVVPWIRHTGLSSAWTKIQHLLKLQDELVNFLEEQYQSAPDMPSLYKLFKEEIEKNSSSAIVTYWDLKKLAFNLMMAGIITSTDTFHAMINLLAHHPHIQQKMYEEIKMIVPDNEDITTSYRHDLHYCKAVLLEVFRFHSVVPLSEPHRSCVDTKIGKYEIPRDVDIIPLTWKLHHDPEFWKDPENFRPERFLDNNGNVHPVDHPTRKNLLPFGAGPRVCVAESMATVRQFLWSTTLVQRYTVKPGPGNEKHLAEYRNFVFDGTVRSERYQVIFTERK